MEEYDIMEHTNNFMSTSRGGLLAHMAVKPTMSPK